MQIQDFAHLVLIPEKKIFLLKYDNNVFWKSADKLMKVIFHIFLCQNILIPFEETFPPRFPTFCHVGNEKSKLFSVDFRRKSEKYISFEFFSFFNDDG